MSEDKTRKPSDQPSDQPSGPPDGREAVEFGEALRKSTDLFPQASTGKDDPPSSMFIEPEEPAPEPTDSSPPPSPPPADED